VFHSKIDICDINTIANIERMLDEEEDARSKDFCSSGRENERE
jgi:hypothetical protein